jgi:iron complex transport system substrate-binding protein
MNHLSISVVAVLFAASLASARMVKDMAGRTVEVPDTVSKVMAPGHAGSIVGAFGPSRVVGGLVRGPAEALLSRAWWSTEPSAKGPPGGGDKPGAAAPPGKSGGPGAMSDSARTARTVAKIRATGVQLVIQEAMGTEAAVRADALQAAAGVPVVLLDLSLLRLPEAFAVLGEVLGETVRADSLRAWYAKSIAPAIAKVAAVPADKRVRFYYAEGKDGLQTEPPGSNHVQALELAGGKNVAAFPSAAVPKAGEAPSPRATLDSLRRWDPDVIFVWSPAADGLGLYSSILLDSSWKTLRAVREGKVHQIPGNPFSWVDRPPGANRMIGVLWAANLFYPEVFPPDMVATVRDFMKVFYGAEISPSQAKALLATHPEPVPPKPAER